MCGAVGSIGWLVGWLVGCFANGSSPHALGRFGSARKHDLLAAIAGNTWGSICLMTAQKQSRP